MCNDLELALVMGGYAAEPHHALCNIDIISFFDNELS